MLQCTVFTGLTHLQKQKLKSWQSLTFRHPLQKKDIFFLLTALLLYMPLVMLIVLKRYVYKFNNNKICYSLFSCWSVYLQTLIYIYTIIKLCEPTTMAYLLFS